VIDAFVGDLRNLFAISGGASVATLTRHVHFCVATTTTVSWTLDDDYFFVGCYGIGNGGNSWSLNTDGANSGAGGGADNEAGKVKLDTVLATGTVIPTSGLFNFSGMCTPLKKNSKIYFVNGTAFTQSINVVIQRQRA